MKTIVWQPGTGLWALLTCESQRQLGTPKVPQIDGPHEPNVAIATSIASSVAPDTRPLGSPVKLGELPDGLRGRRVSYAGPEAGIPGSGQNFTVMLSDENPVTGDQTLKPGPGACGRTVAKGHRANRAVQPGRERGLYAPVR